MDNFVYLIGCPKTKECAVIDCGFDPEIIQQKAKIHNYTITKIFLTHVHYDHSGSADILAALTGADIYMNPESEKKQGINPSKGMWIIPKKTIPVSGGDTIKIGEISGKVHSAPGHQNDHLLYTIGDYLFTGDTLFIGGIGRTDFMDSDPKKMNNTLNKICTLSDDLIVCPGHNYGKKKTNTLREEKETNPFLRNI